MGIWKRGLVLLASSALLAMGCSSTLETFVCETNAECSAEGKTGGFCEASQVCSFSDPSCGASGQRYGSASGERSNQCVGDDARDRDAGGATNNLDASLVDAGNAVDADTSENQPDADSTECQTLLEITVYDDPDADDYVRVREAGDVVLECHPVAAGAGADSVAICKHCMTLGVEIELKAESGIHLSSLTTDCDSDCMNDSNCKFTASTNCSALYYFDAEPLP